MLLRPDRPSKSKVATSSTDTPDDSKDGVVVTTPITSDGYKEAIEDYKLSIQEYRLDLEEFEKQDIHQFLEFAKRKIPLLQR